MSFYVVELPLFISTCIFVISVHFQSLYISLQKKVRRLKNTWANAFIKISFNCNFKSYLWIVIVNETFKNQNVSEDRKQFITLPHDILLDWAEDKFSYHQGRKEVLKCGIIPFIYRRKMIIVSTFFLFHFLSIIIVVHMVWQKCFSFSPQKRFKSEKCFSTIQWKSCNCVCVVCV
jgi:hypothetical protein